MWRDDFMSCFQLEEAQVSRLNSFLEMLSSVKDRNLTAVTALDKIVDVHFRDSLSLLQFPEVSGAKTGVDIGSGAGLPGIPLAIALPDLQITLIEANRKKNEFIKEAAIELGLKNVSVASIRAEDAGHSAMRDHFDLALARAVGPLALVIEYVLPLLKPDGYGVLQRGARKANDEELASSVATQLSGSLDRVVPVCPYPDANNLHVWVIKKTGTTPERFPRRAGVAKKRPLSANQT